MMSMLKSSMEEVRMRFKKPAIVAAIIWAIVIVVVIVQGNLVQLLKGELFQTFILYFMIGGVWYGRYIIFYGGQAPINENTGEPYYPGGFNGSVWRWGCAIAIGATVGAFFFAVDAVRIFVDKIRGIVRMKNTL